jgi:hypothetical protein
MRRWDLLLWSASVAAAGAGAMLILRFNPLGVLRPCPLRMLTGIPCPTCGGTESLMEILHGSLSGAFRANPMVAAAFLLIAASGVAGIATLPWAHHVRAPRRPTGLVLLAAILVPILANWLYLFIRAR